MSVETEILRLQNAKADLKTAINAKGQTITTETLDTYASFVDDIETAGIPTWTKPTGWPDLKAILDADTEDYVGKVAILYGDSVDTFDFDISVMQAQAIKTSDGSFYTTDATHTWDTSEDIDDGTSIKKRWVIWYYNSATSATISSNDQIFLGHPLWIVVGSDGTSFNWKYQNNFLNNFNRQLESIEHYNGGVWDTSSSISMNSMFNSCYSLQTIPLIDTSSSTSMSSMFYSCYSLQTIPLIDTSSATSVANMFYSCSSLQTIPLLDTSTVTSTYNMFGGCSSLKTIPLIDTSSVTNMSNMFSGCSSLKTIPLIDTSSVTNMMYMFSDCYSLQTIPLIDTSSVTFIPSMFNNCYSLQTIPLIDTSLTTSMKSMFDSCSSLQKVSIDTSSSSEIDDLFDNCNLLWDLGTIDLSNIIPSSGIDNDTFDFGSTSGREGIVSFVANSINIPFQIITSITHASLLTLIDGLVDRSATTSQNVVIGATNIAKLNATELGYITAKNWTYS